MMWFEDVFELLEAVRAYKLRPKECLVVTGSVTGDVLGYATADSEFPSKSWVIKTKIAKATALARGTKEGERIRQLLGSFTGRKQLLEELRAGTLEYGIARTHDPVISAPPQPKQCLIPGL